MDRATADDGWRLLALWALTAAFGVAAISATPAGGAAIGIWPVVGGTAALLVTRRPAWPWMALALGLTAFATIQLGRPAAVAAGLAVGVSVQAVVTWWVVAEGRRERPVLRTPQDLARLLVAALAGACCMGVAASATSILTGWSEPVLLAMATGASGLASQVALLPLFCRFRLTARLASRPELLVQWTLVVVITPVVFLPSGTEAIVFVVLPALVWAGLRSGAVQALAQVLVTAALATIMTSFGQGPFAAARAVPGLPADTQGLFLALFIVVCATVVLALVLSVGEQRELARQAATERDRVQRIVDGTLGVAIIGTDLDTHITLFNPGAERLLGYRAEEVLGRSARMLHSAEAIADAAVRFGVEPSHTAIAQAVRRRGPSVVAMRHQDGTERTHLMTLNAVRDDEGRVIGYVSTSEDVTEREEAERRLRDALATERAAVERLQQVDQAKDAFVSTVSHELRTPITSILGYTEMLEDGDYGELTPAQRTAVHRVSTNSARLLTLIGDLLTLSRLQEDGVGLNDRVLDLREVLRSGVAVVTSALDEQRVRLTVETPTTPVRFRGDPDLLERVVFNLVGNAVKFTPDGGEIEVRLETHADGVTLSVADTGIGIPAEELGEVFSRFFRSSVAQQRAIPGTGLGLAITRTIAERHGGRVELESHQGRGTIVRVHLPGDGDLVKRRRDDRRSGPPR